MKEYWQLPAPARFLRRVVEDVREGNNVVIALPRHAPSGWSSALRSALAIPSFPRLEEIPVNGDLPLPALHRSLALGNCSAHANVTDLCANAGFLNRLLHLQDFTPASWRAWSAFLAEYEDACRQFDLVHRTLFIATVQGDSAGEIPPPANLLRVHPWQDRVDSLDIRLHAANLMAGTTLPPWQRQPAVSLLVELALWDPEVCAIGSSLPLADLIQPATWLTQLAQNRGWTAADDVKASPAVWRGLTQPFEGDNRVHSAWLAMASRNEALNQRIWNGQVAALFPLLERHRRALIKSYRGLFRLPMQTDYKLITRHEDLELNHIADQLRSMNSRGLRDTCDFVFWLRDIRNDLAHLSLVSPADLLKPQFSARMSRCPTEDF